MEPLQINYWAILLGSVLSMVVGSIWYGPLFGKMWINIIGLNPEDQEKRKEMQKGAGKLYLIQFILTLFQVLVLAHLIADTTRAVGIERALWIWAAFIVPTLAAGAMWNMDSAKIKWSRFLIQSGYQMVMFAIYGALLQFWK